MNDMIIVDAHSHLWLKQDTVLEGLPVKSLTGGRSEFMGEVRQMMPPYFLDGKNSAEVFLSNMDYARVSAAVVTQEYLDGDQNAYLKEVSAKYPDRFVCCGMVECRKPGYYKQCQDLVANGFKAIKIPAQRLITKNFRVMLDCPEMMEMFAFMEANNIILSIDMADGDLQVGEMQNVIDAFPKLKIAIGHFAMVTREGWLEQVKLAKNENVMIESGGITWLFHSEFYPYPSAIEAIKKAADTVGMEKLMWGSDYPRTMAAITYTMSYDFVLKTNRLTDDEKAKFLGQNAMKFYNLKDLSKPPYVKNMVE